MAIVHTLLMDKKFERWLRKKHLEECSSCKKKGKAQLQDANLLALYLFREFYKEVFG